MSSESGNKNFRVMITPAQHVVREETPGLWEATTGFVVDIEGQEMITAPATALKFTMDTYPVPAQGGTANVGGTGGLRPGNAFVPQDLVSDGVDVDVVPIHVGDGNVERFQGAGNASVQRASPEQIRSEPVDVCVDRDGEMQTLRGSVTVLDDPETVSRFAEGTGHSVAYESYMRVDLDGDSFQHHDAGAPIVMAPSAEEQVRAAGVVLAFTDENDWALVTGLGDLLAYLPLGTNLASS